MDACFSILVCFCWRINNLIGVHPICSTAPRSIIESAVPVTEFKNETQRSVILDPKDDYLVLDDVKVYLHTKLLGRFTPIFYINSVRIFSWAIFGDNFLKFWVSIILPWAQSVSRFNVCWIQTELSTLDYIYQEYLDFS